MPAVLPFAIRLRFRPALLIRGVILHVLFVCTGNICRSPSAERLALAYAMKAGITGFTASSAGTRAVVGHPIHDLAATVIRDLGGDPSNFVAQQLNAKLASSADLILTMTREHRDIVLGVAPHKLHRTFTLGEAADLAATRGALSVADLAVLRPQLAVHEVPEVADPIGQNSDYFHSVGAQISERLMSILELCRAD